MFIHFDGRFKISKHGYVSLWIKGKKSGELFHRIVTDCPRELDVDHIDRNPLNNSSINLRNVDASTNSHNKGMSHYNKSGFEGVSWDPKKRRWEATLKVRGKRFRRRFVNICDAVKHREHLELTYLGYLKKNIRIDISMVGPAKNFYFKINNDLTITISEHGGDGFVSYKSKAQTIKSLRSFLLLELEKIKKESISKATAYIDSLGL